MFYAFDNFGEWALAAGKPITTTCMNNAACFPPAFGALVGLAVLNSTGAVIDDGDWFRFTNDPALTALAFSGFPAPGRNFGLGIMGMGRLDGAPLYLHSTTGFVGVVKKATGTWTPKQVHAAPHCTVTLALMHFAD
jgi:hypothetical protein